MKPDPRPQSVGNSWINLVSVAALLAGFWLLQGSELEKADLGFVVLYAIAAPTLLLEVWFLRVHRRASTGLDWERPWVFAPLRVLVKLFGLLLTLLAMAFLYWLLPEYNGGFYKVFWEFVFRYGPWMLALAVPYFFLVDARMADPQDAYWHLGRMLWRWRDTDWDQLAVHSRNWLIKGFFLPLMFVYLTNNMGNMVNLSIPAWDAHFIRWYDLFYMLLMTIDLGFAAAGYIFSMRFFDTHLRSADPTALGWLVALMCYQPFFSVIGPYYMNYDDNLQWNIWLHEYPSIQIIWGCTILALLAVYSWATVAFGCRFSNLTHRGILTHGPYRFSKHPAYLAKNLSWWLIAIPFVSSAGWVTAVQSCLLLLLLNSLYYLRAITEERHLSRDPLYVEYALWIERHGIMRWVGRIFPWLRYRRP